MNVPSPSSSPSPAPVLEWSDDSPLVSSTRRENAAASSSCVRTTLRILLLDLPLVVILLVYASIAWMDFLHAEYLHPQIEAMIWDGDRQRDENTYYNRPCDHTDISTRNGSDLFLDQDATPEQAYAHQLKHGFTIFRNVLSAETANNLRNHIVSKNYNLTADESIYLHESENRYGFALGTEEPSVRAALKEFASHRQLKESMAKIMGAEPALIELTQITNSYGALDQEYHPDVYVSASATRYARSYAPSYSVFVQLQDTTKEMGATSACAGTHFCSAAGSAGDIDDMCEAEGGGIQVVDEETGVWPSGAALLMNMNSWHRGSAHRDPDGIDRVMFLLTFTTKPQEVAESRLIGAGGTFSNRYDMWGFSWSDMENADTAMVRPWTYLRTLGLYKHWNAASWGVDYVSGSSQRIANEDYGFNEDAMVTLQERHGGLLPYIPQFLQPPNVDPELDMVWYRFLLTTFNNIKSFVDKVVVAATLIVVTLVVVGSIVQQSRSQRLHFFYQSSRRLIILCGMVYLLFATLRSHVRSTQWAKDIKAGRRYASTFENEQDFVPTPYGPTTFPNRHDVLLEQRFGSRRLAMHDDYVRKGHHGNVVLNQLVNGIASTYAVYPDMFREASAQYIVDIIAMGDHSGRFLDQGSGSWHLADRKRSKSFTMQELAKASSPLIRDLLDEIRYSIGGYRFGIYRDSALASKHMVPYLRILEKKILAGPAQKEVATSRPLAHLRTTETITAQDGTILDWTAPVSEPPEAPLFTLSSSLISIPTRSLRTNMRSASAPAMIPKEPHFGAWIVEGSLVEGLVDDHWYVGKVSRVFASGHYWVTFRNEEDDLFDQEEKEIRFIQSYRVGEKLEVHLGPDDDDDDEDGDEDDEDESVWAGCEIVARTDEHYYDIILDSTGEFIEEVPATLFRRDRGVVPERRQKTGFY